jgi:head-tail adaptor
MMAECVMSVFSAAELEGMQATQEAAMMDQCELLIRSESAADDYGMPVVRWLVSGTPMCGLDTKASKEFLQAEAPYYDARVRLAIDTDISGVDRIRITHRFGVELGTPIEYEVQGEAIRGPSGLVVMVRAVI